MDIRIFNQKTVIKDELNKFMNDRDFLFDIDKKQYKYDRIRTILTVFLNIILYLYIGAKVLF